MNGRPPRNLAAELADLARSRGWTDRPALLFEDQVVTYGELHDLAARVGQVLVRHGAGPGRRVLIALSDGPAWVATFLGTVRCGATAVPVNPLLTAHDHGFMADDCAARIVVADEEICSRFTATVVRSGDQLLAEAHQAEAGPVVRTDDPLYLTYTSGTTGSPKGAMFRQGNPRFYHQSIGQALLRSGPTDVTLSVSKLYFGYGLCNSLVFPLYSGGSVVLLRERPGPEAVEELVSRHGVTLLYAVPSAFAGLGRSAEPASFGSVRAAVSAGERLSLELGGRTSDLLGAPVLEQLGQTEVGCAFVANGVGANVAGTVGRAVPGFTVQVRDPEGRPCPDGTVGELWVTGPTLMIGYLNRPEQTAAALRGGWLATNDRGMRNPDGTFVHLGRLDDLEMVGGITVSPLEIEGVLGAHPLVSEVAVAAVPDETGATRLRAYVVPRRPDESGSRLEQDLVGFARERLAPFKVPRTVHLVPALPRTASGKLRRFQLRSGLFAAENLPASPGSSPAGRPEVPHPTATPASTTWLGPDPAGLS
ncbi:acyl-CoA synthase [Frankia sp. CcI49]|uniref:AMP-binding protein n=1 Tax=Frankia sp. CcI49 TaxID=1745382 RepID=UPI000976C274|nr:AMP-binding protein [Frankia sp. CcI49]ONH52411.1 acyl-CoA synthase [Frankia sp. CcI49]